jgi:hypothetical protein
LFWSDVVVAGKASEVKLKTNKEGAKLTFVLDELLPFDCFFTFFSDPLADATGTYIHSFPVAKAGLRSDSSFWLDFFFSCVSAAGIYSYMPSRSFFSFIFSTFAVC